MCEARSWSVQAGYNSGFSGLCAKLRKEYRAYSDKGRIGQKQRSLRGVFKEAEGNLRQTARTREQSVQTAKLLYKLADLALKVAVEECCSEHELSDDQTEEAEQFLAFG